MDSEQINPQDFISLPCDWLFILLIILGALGIPGLKRVAGVCKKTLIFLILVCVCWFVFDLRALFPDQQQFNSVMEAIAPLLVLVIVMWLMWIFFIKKPKP